MSANRWFRIALLGAVLCALLIFALQRVRTRTGAPVAEPTASMTESPLPTLFTSPFKSPLPTFAPPTPEISPEAPPSPTPSAQSRIALRYIAKREGLPIDRLLIANEHVRSYPLLERNFIAFTILDQTSSRSFQLLVDLKDNSVVDDVMAIERTEAAAQKAKYVKLDPLLYDRLETADETELIQIEVWVGGDRGRSTEELYAILAKRHPEVAEALERRANPFDVGDQQLSQQIKLEYEQLSQEDIDSRIAPIVAYLEKQGASVETHHLMPSIGTRLRKSAILALAEREDAVGIYLVEGQAQPAAE